MSKILTNKKLTTKSQSPKSRTLGPSRGKKTSDKGSLFDFVDELIRNDKSFSEFLKDSVRVYDGVFVYWEIVEATHAICRRVSESGEFGAAGKRSKRRKS